MTRDAWPRRRVDHVLHEDPPVEMKLEGGDLVEHEDPPEAHGAGPSRPRRVQRNVFLKGGRS